MSKLYTKTITTPTGKRKYIRAATKEELERKYQQAKLEIGAGVDHDFRRVRPALV